MMLSYAARKAAKNMLTSTLETIGRVSMDPGRSRAIVLCYHSINSRKSSSSIDPEVFRSHVQMLLDEGCRFVTYGSLMNDLRVGKRLRGRTIALTFDDGFADNLTVAAPIMQELGVKGTFFISTGMTLADPRVLSHVLGFTHFDEPYMTPRQVKELHDAGMEIGAHTHTHSNSGLFTRYRFHKRRGSVSRR